MAGTRLVPDWPLPPYRFVPGQSAHPVRSPDGHRYGRSDEEYGPLPEASSYRTHRGYCYALDLFNFGYYWEAHEAFEKWWREADRDDRRRSLFQGLLRIAAAGVKQHERRPGGVKKHLARAAELLAAAAPDGGIILGMDVGAIRRDITAEGRLAAIRLKMVGGGGDT